jgi:hypothetical protein
MTAVPALLEVGPGKGIPVIPMVRILRQYASANNLPFRMTRWEEIIRCFNHYQIHICYKN